MTTDILNLPKWDVLEVEDAHLEYIIKARYIVQPASCPHCGVMFPRLYKYGSKSQPYRDLPIHGKRVRLLVQRKRWKCRECERTFFEVLDDLDDHHRATKRLVAFVQIKALERTFVSLADEIGLDEGTIRNIFNRHVKHLEENVTFKTPRWLGIDELHLLGTPRGVLTNVEARTLIDVLETRKQSVVAKRLMALKDRQTVELVAMDMWVPYRDAVRGVLPQATIVIDKFHVVKMANTAVDLVRKKLREDLTDRQRRTLMHDRFLLFRRRKDLKPEKELLLATWLDQFSDLEAVYTLKEDLFDLWDTKLTSTEALKRYQDWLERAKRSGVLWAYKDLTTALANWEAEVFAYFDHPVTNAATEALNGLAKVVNRMGRGYSFRALRAKMLYSARNRKTEKPEPKEATQVSEERATYDATVDYGPEIGLLAIQFKSFNSDESKEIDMEKVQAEMLSTVQRQFAEAAKRRNSSHNSG